MPRTNHPDSQKEIRIYRRRTLTLMLMLIFGAITVVMIVGLVQSYFPRYTGLSDLKITDTGRSISFILTLFMAGITWRYVEAWIRRGRVPVIRITPEYVRFELTVRDPEVLYFHDVANFEPIEGHFEAAIVHYRINPPQADLNYPSSIEVPLGLTLTRAQVLKILNERCVDGANLPAPPRRKRRDAAAPTPEAEAALQRECEAAARNLPPRNRVVNVYWERWAPVVLEIGIICIIVLLYLVGHSNNFADDYLWFIPLSTWCRIIIDIFIAAGIVVLGYICVAVWSPKLRIASDHIVYRGQRVDFADLENVTVESRRRRAARGRYVTEHFISFNYKPEARHRETLPGLDPDLLEMRPRRIAAIINSRIACS